MSLCVCLTTQCRTPFSGSVCKSFVRRGHYIGFTFWLQSWKISVVFSMDIKTFYQLGNKTAGSKYYASFSSLIRRISPYIYIYIHQLFSRSILLQNWDQIWLSIYTFIVRFAQWLRNNNKEFYYFDLFKEVLLIIQFCVFCISRFLHNYFESWLKIS